MGDPARDAFLAQAAFLARMDRLLGNICGTLLTVDATELVELVRVHEALIRAYVVDFTVGTVEDWKFGFYLGAAHSAYRHIKRIVRAPYFEIDAVGVEFELPARDGTYVASAIASRRAGE